MLQPWQSKYIGLFYLMGRLGLSMRQLLREDDKRVDFFIKERFKSNEGLTRKDAIIMAMYYL